MKPINLKIQLLFGTGSVLKLIEYVLLFSMAEKIGLTRVEIGDAVFWGVLIWLLTMIVGIIIKVIKQSIKENREKSTTGL